MTYDSLIKHFGGALQAAAELGYTHQAIYAWQKRGIPKRSQIIIESNTRGKLKADAK